MTRGRPRIHGFAQAGNKSPEYTAWLNMKRRCSPDHERRDRYFDRGIKVCPEWELSFESFIRDMGPRPGPGYSVEREDNDRGYEPGNCIWATTKQQSSNRSSNRMLTIDGVTKTMSDWSLESGTRVGTIWARKERNWTDREAVFGKEQEHV